MASSPFRSYFGRTRPSHRTKKNVHGRYCKTSQQIAHTYHTRKEYQRIRPETGITHRHSLSPPPSLSTTMLLSSGSFLKGPSFLTAHRSPFLNGSLPLLPKLRISSSSHLPPAPLSISIQAMKKLQGRVVCATNDKTVAVEVIRLAPHPKYKRRVRKKKKYQAHDPDNLFKVGDFVQLEKSRPISKTKTFIAIPVVSRNAPKPVEAVSSSILDLPLQSQGKSELESEAEQEESADAR